MTQKEIVGSVLVQGGGIAGIQTALDLANSGYFVHLVERTPSIGGVMAQLDKTFPTNDCSMCIMSPKLVEVGRHLNIELITLADITAVRGEEGRFEVDLRRRPRFVDLEKCIACGACAGKCPKKVDDEYNRGLIQRKAIYVPYPQAVPLKYAIDPDACIMLLKGKCGACKKICPTGAVNFEDRETTLTLKVGSIVLANGFKTFDPAGRLAYGYDASEDVVTSLEFERLLSASGPFKGHVVRPSDHVPPRKIAWLQCVGSRDINTCDNPHCSSVCCMYAIKQAIIAKEHDPRLECTIFFMDMRTHGKGFEACYNEAKSKHGIRFIRCRVHSVFNRGGEEKGQVIDYLDETTGKSVREIFDIVVLSVGMEISGEVKALAARLGLDATRGGFLKTSAFDPVATTRPGIYVSGALQGPKDIPQSVIEGGAAALRAGKALAAARGTLTRSVIPPPERNVRGDRPRVGVFVCHCGINIGGVINVPAVRDYAATLPYVEYADDNIYSCSQDTQDTIAKLIREKDLNRIVVAACTPRTHDPLFMETLASAGLNKYLFEMVNIRNHGSWVHKDCPEAATEKAKDLVRMAVAKVALFTPLVEAELTIDQNALVIGGGISGMSAALALADQGYHVSILEQDVRLGGNANRLYQTAGGESVPEALGGMIREVESHQRIDTYLGASIAHVEGFVGNFDTTFDWNGASKTIRHGVTIMATGAAELKPGEYGYGESPRVVTGQELDGMLIARDPALERLNAAAFIQCVGSRIPERPYCSRICCTHSVLSALHLKEKNPEAQVYVLYRDIRTYGEREYLYKQAREKGVIFIRYSLEDKPKVCASEAGVEITVTDHVLRQPLKLTVELLALASAVVPRRSEKLAQLFKVPINSEGFFAEAHVKLAPSNFATDGVFLCGLAHYPKPIDEAVAQAQAAASSAVRLLAQRTIKTSACVAEASPLVCSGCGTCTVVCPYNAPALRTAGPYAGKAEINPVLCKGCGACVASCRSGALHLKGFDEDQLLTMVETALCQEAC